MDISSPKNNIILMTLINFKILFHSALPLIEFAFQNKHRFIKNPIRKREGGFINIINMIVKNTIINAKSNTLMLLIEAM